MKVDHLNQASAEPTAPQRILHVDINSYFATLLQQENPALRGRSVGVLKSAGRTCVIAASKEAKRHGVKTGMYLKEAKRLAPDLITVAAEFDRYLDCTRRLKKIFTDLAPSVYIFSLDEAFIDISDCGRIYPDAEAFGRLVQEQIKKDLGEWVTCNVGISHNRLLAKIASEISPPDSVFSINESNKDSILAAVEFKDVCGIGYRLGARLEMLGIKNPYGINFLSDEELLTNFGPFWSKELRRIGKGEDSHVLSLVNARDVAPMKSVGRTITGYGLCDDETRIKQTLYNLTTELVYKVRKMEMAGRHIGISLWGEDQSWYAHRTLKYYVNHTQELFHLLYDELYGQTKRQFKVIKYGVFLSDLKFLDQIPVHLFPEWHRQERVNQAIDKVTERYGLFTIKPATMLNFKMIRPEVTGYLGDKKYYGL
jgi:DNA polymerase IV